MNNFKKILAIESSCDESAVAIFDSSVGVCDDLVHSQIDLHALYGGVVPDLASSEHLKKLPLLIEEISKSKNFSDIDCIVCTNSPGLPNCLAIGISCASALSLGIGKPLFGVNHLKGHAFSPFISEHKKSPKDFLVEFEKHYLPHMGLIVSGGNSILIEIDRNRKIKMLAETLDDAAGEALDKGAKLLGLPYPGGPELERRAIGGNIKKFEFPYGLNKNLDENPDFSFSGLKTSLRYFLQKHNGIEEDFSDICASYQNAVIQQLVRRTKHFLNKSRYKSLGISGGVANNLSLRGAFKDLSDKFGIKFLPCERRYCGDNASMISFAFYMDFDGCMPSQNGTLPLLSSLGF